MAIALAFSLIAAESAPAKSTGPISAWLARFSYEIYPAVAVVFLIVLLAEVLYRPRTEDLELRGIGATHPEGTDHLAASAPVVAPMSDGPGEGPTW